MIKFNELPIHEQEVFLAIEKIFINHKCIDRKSFVKILGMMINKYKLSDSIKGTLSGGLMFPLEKF
jgi:hypothetical protein